MGKGFAHPTLTKDTADKVTWLATKADNLYMGKRMTKGLNPIGALMHTGLALMLYFRLIKPKGPLWE